MKHMMIKVLSLVMALTMIMGMFGAVAVSAAGHTHTKGEKVKTVAPTCVAYGYTLYECAGCGEQYADDVLPKTEECQNIEDVKAVDATCTADAITAGKKCKDCGEYVEGGEVVPNTALGHSYDIMLIQPTCEKPGAVIEACVRCYDAKKAWTAQADGAVKDNKDLMDGALAALNGTHTYVYTITVAPTCSEAGRATYKCAKCDEVTIENIYVAPSEALHVWVDVKDEPTCTTAGLDGKECTECWAYRSNKDTNGDGLYDMKDAVPATNHKNAVAITAANKAQHLVWLTQMGFDIEDLTKAETCTEAGYAWKYCPDCKSYVKFDYKALGHTLPNMADEKLVKSVLEAVKDQKKGATVNVTDEKGNVYSFVIVSVADCEKGTVIACTRSAAPYNCKETITLDNALTEGHTHDWNTEPSDKKTAAGKWEITAPTCTTAGWTTVYCKKCPATKIVNVVNALGHELKYTGDDCTVGIVVTCKRCTATFDTIKNEKHTTVVQKIGATCNTYAYDANVCTVPGCKYSVAVDANNDGKADKVYTEEGFDATKHSAKIKVEGAYYVPATCVTEGLATYACKNCAASSWTEVLPKLDEEDHNWIYVEQVDATCQNEGRTAGYVCTTCPTLPEVMAEYAKKGFVTNDGSLVLTGKDADGEAASTNGAAYVWVSGGAKIAKDKNNHETTITKFHRVGTCTMPELYLYECACGATWSKEGAKDAKNHNTYIYNGLNEVIGGTYFAGTIDSENHPTVPSTVVAGEHWGALLTYVAGKQANCETAGNHNYVKCTGCNEIVVVSGYKIDFDAADGTFTVTNNFDCKLCEAYVADQIEANDKDNTAGAGVIACPGMTLVLKDAGKTTCTIDKTKTTWTVDVAATGHKEKAVAAVQEKCDHEYNNDGTIKVDGSGYTAGVKCENDQCNLTASNDGNKYISGHVLIPVHAGRYNTTYNKANNAAADLSKAATCTEYGIDANKTYCKVCDSRITDITKKDWYIKPLGHDLVNVTGGATKDCDEIGFEVYRCSRNCSAGSVWADINANTVVDVYGNGFTTLLKDSEYTWFVTNYELATGHKWPEYNLTKKTGYETGWFYNGEILTTAEFKAEFGMKPNACLIDKIYYIACADCGERKAVADAIAAPGHVHVNGEVKTPISTNCNEIEKFYGFNCAACGLQIVDKANTTHDLVVVVTPTTCSNPGKYYWACKDCNKAFYVENKEDAAPLYELYTPEEIDWDAVAKELEAGNTTNHKRIEKPCETKFAKIDEYVKATATADGYFKYTCQTCGETVTKVLPADEEVLFTFEAADVLGSKVTANGNEIVISIAYTAKSFKFRTFNLGVWFDDAALTFNKAEVKATFAEELAVTTDVAVDEDYIDILTAVNVAKAEAELTGEDVAYVDLYFTVNDTTSHGIIEDYIGAYVEALVYNEAGKLVTVDIYSGIFDADVEEDVLAGYTGDVDGDDVINTVDLVALMDMIYTADAKYVAAADINKDGKIDIDDYAALRTFTASKQFADDYAAMMGVELPEIDYATMIVDTLRVQKIDLNKDGIVNALDYQHLVVNSNSYAARQLKVLYDLDWTEADWDNFFYSTYTVEDITELVLEAYAAMLI